MHWAIVCRGLASSLLGNHCRGAWAAPRLHPCSGGICFQCPCHPAALPAVRSRLPSKQCRRSNPGREPAASCGRSDPCPGAASPSTTSVVPGSGQGSDFSFNRSWPWSGGLPSPFPAAAARVVATAQSATIACGRWSLPDRRLGSTPKSKNLVFSHPAQKTEVLLKMVVVLARGGAPRMCGLAIGGCLDLLPWTSP